MIIRIRLFGCFCLVIDYRKIVLTARESELLALLTLSGGCKITAKNYWEIVLKPKKYAYNAKLYSSTVRMLQQSLASLGAEDMLEMGLDPVRYCRLNTNAVTCDYYEMLECKAELMTKDMFLPEYSWAADLYCQNREELKIMQGSSIFEK